MYGADFDYDSLFTYHNRDCKPITVNHSVRSIFTSKSLRILHMNHVAQHERGIDSVALFRHNVLYAVVVIRLL